MSRQWDTGRTEAFSDGVLGVAITLLVLDINIPQSQVKHFWYSIIHLWPTYLAYLTSFATVGGLVLAHHGIFARLRQVDRRCVQQPAGNPVDSERWAGTVTCGDGR